MHLTPWDCRMPVRQCRIRHVFWGRGVVDFEQLAFWREGDLGGVPLFDRADVIARQVSRQTCWLTEALPSMVTSVRGPSIRNSAISTGTGIGQAGRSQILTRRLR